ncbi:MAG TPA: shikimate kinase [Longimicrobiales bacterium]|nr:shikimate kinase [Longimicrobiales bacterium]
MTRVAPQRVLLVGFMGSGKTSVGRELADRLGWRFVDFDEAVEAELGATVPEVFERQGEARFREVEARVAGRLLRERRVVLGSGGGWAAVPGRLADVPPGTAAFWLKVSPEEAIRRVGREPGKRPLLDRPDALDEARRLLGERSMLYAEAHWTVDTEGSAVEDVTARILEILAPEHLDSDLE